MSDSNQELYLRFGKGRKSSEKREKTRLQSAGRFGLRNLKVLIGFSRLLLVFIGSVFLLAPAEGFPGEWAEQTFLLWITPDWSGLLWITLDHSGLRSELWSTQSSEVFGDSHFLSQPKR